ncbi:MAG: hypothetical protein LBC95_03430 [Candidatus Nomurabacteria bacterium]|jgi:hypothetical protein|nr:hypothetical protein [Candidatus Nomurabacteria bacterium]
MLIFAFFSWWYTTGFREQLAKIKMSFVKLNDQFSIPLLLKTLFQPFRQISAGKVDGALSDKIRAWGDRMVSRAIGGFIRTTVMLIGLVVMAACGIFSGLRIIIWLAMPILPLTSFAIMSWVVVPWI